MVFRHSRKIAVPYIFASVVSSGMLMQFYITRESDFITSQAPKGFLQQILVFFSNKRNPLNQYFAKQSWGWTTLAFLLLCGVSYAGIASDADGKSITTTTSTSTEKTKTKGKINSNSKSKSKNGQATRLLRYSFVQYLLATAYWILMTQWCFGASVFDRLYTYTGGGCYIDTVGSSNPTSGSVSGSGPSETVMAMLAEITTYQMCRRHGGVWQGGVDVSGHCFLLLHSALFLAYVGLPLDSIAAATASSHKKLFSGFQPLRYVALVLTSFLIVLWACLLFFTTWKFHDYPETVAGCLFAMAYWAVSLSLFGTSTLGQDFDQGQDSSLQHKSQ